MRKKLEEIYWSHWFRNTLKTLTHGLVIALISLALGLLINDVWRGYWIVILLRTAAGIFDWAKEEFQFV